MVRIQAQITKAFGFRADFLVQLKGAKQKPSNGASNTGPILFAMSQVAKTHNWQRTQLIWFNELLPSPVYWAVASDGASANKSPWR